MSSSRVVDYRPWLVPGLAFVVLTAGITLAAALHLRGFERDLRATVERELATIADLKVSQIVEWREHMIGDAADLGRPPASGTLVEGVSPRATPLERAGALRRIELRVQRNGLENGVIVDEAGLVLLATEPRAALEREELDALREAFRRDRPFLVDLERDGGAIRLVVPVAATGEPRIAVLLSGRVAVSLPKSVRAWPSQSRSAEAFLASVHGDEVVILDALRFTGGDPYPPRFHLPGAQFALAEAARGNEGTGRHFDHRHQPVLAARRRIPDSSWVLSAKMSEEELLAPAQERARSLSLAIAAIVVAFGAALIFWWRGERAELRRRERDLAERERVERLQYMWKYAHDAVLIADEEGRIVDVNDRAVELYGHTRQELLSKHVQDLRTPEERPGLSAIWQRLRTDPSGVLVETFHQRKDGSAVPVEVGARLLQSDQRQYLYCIVRDVTERRNAEHEARVQGERLRSAQAQLAFSDRLASIGTLAAGVAHEINNPLAYVMSNLEFLRDALRTPRQQAPPATATLDAAVEESREGVQRIAEIVRTLRTFSRRDRDPGAPQPLDLRDPVRAAIRIASNEVRARAQLCVELSDVPPVAAPEHELAQVAVNLIVNAAQAIPEGHEREHTVTVRTREDAGWAVLEVVDTGSGIAPEHLGRIFDPFFTTKPVGEGTGLGLSVCLGIIEGLGGRLEVESRPGQGSTFRVRLPSSTSVDGRGSASASAA